MVSLREGLGLGDGGVISLVGAGGKTTLMFNLAHELASAGEPVLTTTTTKIYEPKPQQSSNLIITASVPKMLEEARAVLEKRRHITAAAANIPDQGKLRGFSSEDVREIWRHHLFRWIIVEADGAAGRPLKAPAEYEPVVPACTSRLVGIVGLNGAGQPLTEQWVFRHDLFMRLSGLAYGATISDEAIVAALVHKNGIFQNAPVDAERIVFCNQADIPQNCAAGRRIAAALLTKKKTGLNRVVVGHALSTPPILEVHDLNAQPEYEV